MQANQAQQVLARVLEQEDIDWLARQGSDVLIDAALIVQQQKRRLKTDKMVLKWLMTPVGRFNGSSRLAMIGAGYAYEFLPTRPSRNTRNG